MVAEMMWAVAAAILFVVAAGSSTATLAGRGRSWPVLSVAARGGAILALFVALVLAAASSGGWSPLNLRQIALSLALATGVAHLVLSWAAGSAPGSPFADAAAAALALTAWLASPAIGDSLTCLQRSLAYRAEWVLFLSGAGGALVAGSAALTLALPWLRARAGASRLLTASSFLVVLALGGGIVIGVWWTWQATGALAAGDIREMWMAVVWLLAAMSIVAWQLVKGAAPWAGGLALAAAGAALLGLFALSELQRLVGM